MGRSSPACLPCWVLWTSQELEQERLERERLRHHCLPVPAAAHACLLTLEVSYNSLLRGPSPDFPETLRLHAAAQSSRSGPPSSSPPPPAPSAFPAAFSFSTCKAVTSFTAHTLGVCSVKCVSSSACSPQPSICEKGLTKEVREPHSSVGSMYQKTQI